MIDRLFPYCLVKSRIRKLKFDLEPGAGEFVRTIVLARHSGPPAAEHDISRGQGAGGGLNNILGPEAGRRTRLPSPCAQGSLDPAVGSRAGTRARKARRCRHRYRGRVFVLGTFAATHHVPSIGSFASQKKMKEKFVAPGEAGMRTSTVVGLGVVAPIRYRGQKQPPEE